MNRGETISRGERGKGSQPGEKILREKGDLRGGEGLRGERGGRMSTGKGGKTS